MSEYKISSFILIVCVQMEIHGVDERKEVDNYYWYRISIQPTIHPSVHHPSTRLPILPPCVSGIDSTATIHT